jgi:hypothetical protein
MDHESPEWLRGCVLWHQLPRRLVTCVQNETHRATMTDREQAEIIVWIVENTHGRWDIHTRRIYFADDADAVHFRLRWGLGSD